jgi:hypothetical protein
MSRWVPLGASKLWKIGVLNAMRLCCRGSSCVSSVWRVTPSASESGGDSTGGLNFWWCYLSTESWFSGWKPKLWPLLVVLVSGLCEGIVLETRIFSRVIVRQKHVCILSFLEAFLLEILFVVRVLTLVVVRAVLLGVFGHAASFFFLLFYFILFFWLCASLMSLNFLLVQKLGVIDIFMILIYFFYIEI